MSLLLPNRSGIAAAPMPPDQPLLPRPRRWALPARFRRRGRFVRCESGSAIIEFAVTLSALMTFLFAVMELCLAYYTNGMISEAAREGTRYAMVRGSTCKTSTGGSCTVTAAQIQTYVGGLGYPNIGGATITPVASFPDGDEVPGHRVEVSITYTFPIRMPLIPTKALSLSSTSVMTIVQ